MKILFVDTTTADLVVAIIEDEVVHNFSLQNCGLRHSEILCNRVAEAMQACNLSFADLDAYACAVGPGSFTGIRIGVSALKGYALACPKPLIGVYSLEAIACSAECGNKGRAVINAGNGYYFADYSAGVTPCLVSYDDIRAVDAGRCESAAQCLDGFVSIVRERFANGQFGELSPLYIRRSSAEEKL